MWSRNTPRQSIPCRDIAGRHRDVLVDVADTGHVVLIVPPGEVAQLSIDGARALWVALRLAVIDAAGTRRPEAHANPGLAYREVNGLFLVNVRDAVGRADRSIMVTPVSKGYVLVKAPAGGVAVLAPLAVGALRGALSVAAGRAVGPGHTSVAPPAGASSRRMSA